MTFSSPLIQLDCEEVSVCKGVCGTISKTDEKSEQVAPLASHSWKLGEKMGTEERGKLSCATLIRSGPQPSSCTSLLAGPWGPRVSAQASEDVTPPLLGAEGRLARALCSVGSSFAFAALKPGVVASTRLPCLPTCLPPSPGRQADTHF